MKLVHGIAYHVLRLMGLPHADWREAFAKQDQTKPNAQKKYLKAFQVCLGLFKSVWPALDVNEYATNLT